MDVRPITEHEAPVEVSDLEQELVNAGADEATVRRFRDASATWGYFLAPIKGFRG